MAARLATIAAGCRGAQPLPGVHTVQAAPTTPLRQDSGLELQPSGRAVRVIHGADTNALQNRPFAITALAAKHRAGQPKGPLQTVSFCSGPFGAIEDGASEPERRLVVDEVERSSYIGDFEVFGHIGGAFCVVKTIGSYFKKETIVVLL